MKAVRKVLVRLLISLTLIYSFICTLLYFNQESILFHPDKLAMKHKFESEVPFEELFIQTADGIKLNALLFKAEHSKGLIFYVHGNAGSLNGWKGIAEAYTKLGYDLFIFDFRGFGKSQGEISSEAIYFGSALKLQKLLKSKDQFFPLEEQGHIGMDENPVYQQELRKPPIFQTYTAQPRQSECLV